MAIIMELILTKHYVKLVLLDVRLVLLLLIVKLVIQVTDYLGVLVSNVQLSVLNVVLEDVAHVRQELL